MFRIVLIFKIQQQYIIPSGKYESEVRLDEQNQKGHLRNLMAGKAPPRVKFCGLPDCSNAHDSCITNTEQIVCR